MPRVDEDGITQPGSGEWDGLVLSSRRVADYKPYTFVDGEGVRCSLYVAGCPFTCPGCYNEAAQSFRYGTPYSQELEDRILTDLAKPYVAGLSLLGGEPMLATPILLPLAQRVSAEFAGEKTIWIWSGYTYEQIMADTEDKIALLDLCDVLVDGPFIQRLYHHDLAFRGSANQRIIDLAASRARGTAVPWRSSGPDREDSVPFLSPAPPPS